MCLLNYSHVHEVFGLNSIVGDKNYYIFQGQKFEQGVLVLNLYALGCVTQEYDPPKDEVVPFAELGIDTQAINTYLMQLHLHISDQVTIEGGRLTTSISYHHR